MEPLEKKISQLPESLQNQVSDYIDILLIQNQTSSKQRKKPTLKWFGGLQDLKDKYTSIELQKKIIDWID